MRNLLFKKFLAIELLVAAFLCGCSYQISSLSNYNGRVNKPTNKCLVTRTSIEHKINSVFDEYKDLILGDSRVSTNASYENEEAAYDCMAVGASSALVFNRGIISSNTVIIHEVIGNIHSDYSETKETSDYIIVFFKEKLPIDGKEITFKDYSKWKEHYGLSSCNGCKVFK